MGQSFNGASQNPAHKPPSRQHDKVRSVRLLVALALTLILASIANTAAQSLNLQAATAMPMATSSKAARPAASAPEPDRLVSAKCQRARSDLETALGEANDRHADAAPALAATAGRAAIPVHPARRTGNGTCRARRATAPGGDSASLCH